MKKSDLQFSNPRIDSIDFRVNDKNTKIDDMPISIETNCKVNEEKKEAVVNLNLVIGNIDRNNIVNTAFYFNGNILANFKWNNNIKDPKNMLKISGGTVLLSYIRPILANLTLQAGLKPLNLPFINFKED